jgi:hypothetical protein
VFNSNRELLHEITIHLAFKDPTAEALVVGQFGASAAGSALDNAQV